MFLCAQKHRQKTYILVLLGNTVEHISIKLEDDFLRDLERIIKKNRYSTKTEFIREAIRDKIEEIERKEMLKHIERIAGKSKRKTSDEQLHKAGERVFEELAKEYGIKIKNKP